MMLLKRPMVVASRDGVVFGSLQCVEADFGDGVVDLVLSDVPAIEVESGAWLTHPTVHPVAIELGEDLWVQVRSGQSVWCCCGVVIGYERADLFHQSPRFVVSVALAVCGDCLVNVAPAGDLVGVLWPGG